MALTDDLPINVYDMVIATTGDSMAPSGIAKAIAHHRGMVKNPRVLFKGDPNKVRGTRKIYGEPELILWDEVEWINHSFDIDPNVKNIVIDSLSTLDAKAQIHASCVKDDCSWKQGQVAKWCNKYPKKGRKR